MFSKYLEDGTIVTVIYDQPEDKNPENIGVVRFRVPIAGFKIVPDPHDKNKCSCTQINEYNLGPNVPPYVINIFNWQKAQGLLKLSQLIPNWLSTLSNDQKLTWE